MQKIQKFRKKIHFNIIKVILTRVMLNIFKHLYSIKNKQIQFNAQSTNSSTLTTSNISYS
jgi:hypothetical protein